MTLLTSSLRLLTVLTVIGLGSRGDADAAQVERVLELMQVDEIIEIMAEEGIAYGDELAQEMFPGRGGSAWDDDLGRIYDVARMQETVRTAFHQLLDPREDITAPALVFFESPLGQRAIVAETRTRRLMLDEDIEDTARAAGLALEQTDPDYAAQIERFMTANDLVERNVVGGLNSNVAFLTGLAGGGGIGGAGLTESEILRQVWSGEAELRADTGAWLTGYLGMAYKLLDTGDLEGYIAFSETEEGKALVDASFAAYDALFNEVSLALGAAAARQISAQEL